MRHVMIVALTVLGLCVAAQPVTVRVEAKKMAGKTMSASGVVKSVSGTSLVVTGGGKDWTFMVDGSTRFTGKGLGTKSKASSGKMMATDAVHEGDSVKVAYHDMGGTMHAASVMVTSSKSMMK